MKLHVKAIWAINAIVALCVMVLIAFEVTGLAGVMRWCKGGCDFTGIFGG